jgi:transcriptional regulator with PAS, ATPase and Fis domain
MKPESEQIIKRNLVRRYAYDLVARTAAVKGDDFPLLFRAWAAAKTSIQPVKQVDSPVHRLCEQIDSALSAKESLELTEYMPLEQLLIEPDDYLAVNERIRSDRFDLWGAEVDEAEIIRSMCDNLVGSEACWLSVIEMAARAAQCNFPVLITGDTGTGKEMVAREIHRHSGRAGRDCVVVNCGALPESLLESELFGYAPGAFTGASQKGRMGWLERADGGTLILDEISELSPGAQVALLRALNYGELQKIGAEILKVDFRLIAISNQDLEAWVDAGRFRRDLYYRIAVVPIHLPPLSARLEDIERFARHFIDKFLRQNPKLSVRETSPAALAVLKTYAWHGNVRELENVIARAMVLCKSETIAPEHLIFTTRQISATPPGEDLASRLKNLHGLLTVKKRLSELVMFLGQHRDMITSSDYARALNVSESTARKQLKSMVEAGLLERRGDKKGAHYVLLETAT